MVRKQTKYLDTVAYLVKSHLKCDRKMTRAFLCSSENDGVIRLLEVSESVPPMEEVLPFDFDAAPNDNIPYPSSIILIAPEDMEKIETGRMSLPVGWLPVWQAVDYTFLKKTSETIKKG